MGIQDDIQAALRECRVVDDDLGWMSEIIMERLQAKYEITPKEDEGLIERLDRIQKAILGGEDPEEELAACMEEADEARFREGLTFEEAEAWERLRRKAQYLQELLHRLRYRRNIRRLQEELQRMVSPEAWAVYLRIEEEVNIEMWRLQEGATG